MINVLKKYAAINFWGNLITIDTIASAKFDSTESSPTTKAGVFYNFISYKDNVYLHILALYTKEHYRKQGLASRLLKFLEDEAHRYRTCGLYLQCKPELIPFYEQFGFVKHKSLKNKIIMIKYYYE